MGTHDVHHYKESNSSKRILQVVCVKMGVLRTITLIFVFTTTAVLVEGGGNRYDLFSVFNMRSNQEPPAGTNKVQGPEVPTKSIDMREWLKMGEAERKEVGAKSTKALEFTGSQGDIKQSDTFINIATNLQKLDYVTFSVYFRIPSLDEKSKKINFPFFSMANTEETLNFFAIQLEYKKTCKDVESKEVDCKKGWYILLRTKKVDHDGTSRSTSLPKDDNKRLNITLGAWTILTVRIEIDQVTVSLNCEEVASGKIGDGRIGSFPYQGVMRVGQAKFKSLQKFDGFMYQPQLLFSEAMDKYYNPCTRDFTPSVVAPEANSYDESKFNEFNLINSEKVVEPERFCFDENKEVIKNSKGERVRNNGDPWYDAGDDATKCNEKACKDGKVVVFYQCTNCTDAATGKIYTVGETWIDQTDKCLQYTCTPGKVGWFTAAKKSDKIKCPDLKCAEEDRYTPDGACCPKCRQEDCTQERKYELGCERQCESNPLAACALTTKKCWCPNNWALNIAGTKCVRAWECGCKVFTGEEEDDEGVMVKTYKIYLSGQSIRRSFCTLCLCQFGELSCSSVC